MDSPVRRLALCYSCAELMREAFRLRELPGNGRKAVCARCGKRLYLDDYEIERKSRDGND